MFCVIFRASLVKMAEKVEKEKTELAVHQDPLAFLGLQERRENPAMSRWDVPGIQDLLVLEDLGVTMG